MGKKLVAIRLTAKLYIERERKNKKRRKKRLEMEERGRREIGKVIKLVLKNRGISLVEGAKKLGISKQLMNYTLNEKEDKNWDEWEIKKWCEVLKIREEEIRKRVNI